MSVTVKELPNGGFRIEGINETQEEKIKDFLTFTNPKYEAAKKYSKWGTPVNIPRYLQYYEIPREGIIDVPYGFPVGEFFPELEVQREEYIINNNNNTFFSPFKYSLRESQQEAFNAYFDSLGGTDNHSQIVMPTGKGKTILAIAIAAKLGVRTLVVVHKNDLIKVWLEDIALSLEMPAGLIQGKTRNIDSITIATVQTLNSMRKNGKFTDEFLNMFGFIIVDEAHHCPASTYDVIDDFHAKYRLGLTATPERNDGLTHVLNLFFGSPCYVYQKSAEEKDILPVIVYTREIPLEYNPVVEVTKVSQKTGAVQIKLVSEFAGFDTAVFDCENLFYMSELRGQKIDFPADFNRQTMERSIVNHEMTFLEVLRDLKFEVLTKGHSCILFFKQKEEVDFWFQKLQVLELFNLATYYGDNSDLENESTLKDVESGKINVTLATLAKCGEGTNCKAWESVFLISDIGNGKDVEQCIGRARRTKEGKEKFVTVYDYNYPNIRGLNYFEHFKVRMSRYIALNFGFRALPEGYRPSRKYAVGYPKRI